MGVAIGRPAIRHGHVFLVRFDPTLGSEIKKTRRASSCLLTN
jgi:hypothetical protein